MPLSSPNQPTAAMSVAAGMLVGTVFQQPLSHKLVLLARGSRWNSRSSQFSHSYLSSWHPSCNPNCCYFFAQKKNATVKPFVVQRKTFKYVVSSPVKPLFLVFHIKGRWDSYGFIMIHLFISYSLLSTNIHSYHLISMNIHEYQMILTIVNIVSHRIVNIGSPETLHDLHDPTACSLTAARCLSSEARNLDNCSSCRLISWIQPPNRTKLELGW